MTIAFNSETTGQSETSPHLSRCLNIGKSAAVSGTDGTSPLVLVPLSRPDAQEKEDIKHKLNQSDDVLVKLSANEGIVSVSANDRVLIASSQLRGSLTPVFFSSTKFSKWNPAYGH